LSGVDRKSVRHVGSYGNAVSLSWDSDTHSQRLTGHRIKTTSKKCAFGSYVYPVYTTVQHPFQAYNRTTFGLLLETHNCVQERNGDNQTQEPGLERRKKGLVRDLAHTKKNKKVRKTPMFTNLKKRFEHIELPAKLMD